MIVSHKYRFIFIHCRKTAGSSVKLALYPSLGDDDIVIGSLHEILAAGFQLNQKASSDLKTPKAAVFYCAARAIGKNHGEAVNIAIKRIYTNKLSKNPPHPTASEASLYLQDVWSSYYKFGFVRNPYEQVASDYYWRLRSTKKSFSFAEFVESLAARESDSGIVHRGAASNWDMLTIDDKIAVDRIGKYEHLNDDFHAICQHLGLSGVDLEKRSKVGGFRSEYGHLYTDKEKQTVADIYRKEIELFDYQFPF